MISWLRSKKIRSGSDDKKAGLADPPGHSPGAGEHLPGNPFHWSGLTLDCVARDDKKGNKYETIRL